MPPGHGVKGLLLSPRVAARHAWWGLWVLLLGALLPLRLGAAPDERFHIYLCLGQSNMEGFPGIPDGERGYQNPRFKVLAAVDFPEQGRRAGQWYEAAPPLSRPSAGMSPADGFGRALSARLPADQRVGVVVVAVGGCKIELFEPTSAPAYVAEAPDWMQAALQAYQRQPYQRLVELGRLAQQEGVIRGILLHQGESNVGDAAWPAKVESVYRHLLSDLGLSADKVPLLVGGVVAAEQQGKCAAMNAVIAALPERIPTAHFVSSVGCDVTADLIHFSPAGYLELGRRYAETAWSLLETQKGGPP